MLIMQSKKTLHFTAGFCRCWSKRAVWTEQEGGSRKQREEAHETRHEAQ